MMTHKPKYTDQKPDDPYWGYLHVCSRFGPHLFDYLRELTDVVAEYENRIMIFEDYPDEAYTTRDQYLGFYGVNPRVSMPFNFEGIGLPFTADAYRNFVTEFQGFLNQEEHTPVYCFGNHDQHRLASRTGKAQARVVAFTQLCLPGLPVIYYGDELGMTNGFIPPEEAQDPVQLRKPELNEGRDPERTPMQWDGTKTAGFTTVKPWLPIAEGADECNVAAEQGDDDSYLALYRQLLALRSGLDILRHGDYESVSGEADQQVFAFGRRLDNQHVFVAGNFSRKPATFPLPHGGRVLASTHPSKPPGIDQTGTIHLAAHEAALVECAKHTLGRNEERGMQNEELRIENSEFRIKNDE
ncbi:DUF3459 domain-containing protein [Candidatus Saccharibacteria bacterium]|nr:MAG: DUF3459 domain-containing protein [Candidatus Saccharibacteria bacterium]